MTLTFWLIAASLGLASAGLVVPRQEDLGYNYGAIHGGDDGSRKWSKTLSKEWPNFCLDVDAFFKFESAALV